MAWLVPVQCSRMACAASIRCFAWSATCVSATSANLSVRRDEFMHVHTCTSSVYLLSITERRSHSFLELFFVVYTYT